MRLRLIDLSLISDNRLDESNGCLWILRDRISPEIDSRYADRNNFRRGPDSRVEYLSSPREVFVLVKWYLRNVNFASCFAILIERQNDFINT